MVCETFFALIKSTSCLSIAVVTTRRLVAPCPASREKNGPLRTRSVKRFSRLGWASLPGISGSQADGRGPLVVVARFAAVLGSVGPQHLVCPHRIYLAFIH